MLTIEKPRAVFGGHARPRWRLAIIIRVPNYFEYARIGAKQRQMSAAVGGRSAKRWVSRHMDLKAAVCFIVKPFKPPSPRR